MPDEDDRFGDVADQLKRTENAGAAGDGESDEGSGIPSTGEGTTDEVDPGSPPTGHEAAENETSANGPAFGFDETDMHGFYVRAGTWDRVTRMRSSVTAACSVFDLSEFEGREFQDACLRVIAEHADEVALQILRERGIEADEERIREVVEMLNAKAETK